jgi:hypothetical protein
MSLLTVVIDLNLPAWKRFGPDTLRIALNSILLFAKSHMAINESNQVCLVLCADDIPIVCSADNSLASEMEWDKNVDNDGVYSALSLFDRKARGIISRVISSMDSGKLQMFMETDGS